MKDKEHRLLNVEKADGYFCPLE